jgi:hypothetical protein
MESRSQIRTDRATRRLAETNLRLYVNNAYVVVTVCRARLKSLAITKLWTNIGQTAPRHGVKSPCKSGNYSSWIGREQYDRDR